MLSGIAAHPASWGIFSWNSTDPQPWPDVLDQMAVAGYEGLELGRLGFFPSDPGRLRPALAARHLTLIAGFVVESLIDADIDAVARRANEVSAFLAQMGAAHLVIIDAIAASSRSATAGRSNAAMRLDDGDWRKLVTTTTRIATVAREHGLTTALHHHAGTRVEFEDEIERLLADTESELVGLCLDTGHAIYAGFDPISFYRRYSDRVLYLHLKDVNGTQLSESLHRRHSFQEAVGAGVFCPLGEGELDLRGLRVVLDSAAYSGWATVEQDRLTEKEVSALDDARASRRCLESVGLAGPQVVR